MSKAHTTPCSFSTTRSLVAPPLLVASLSLLSCVIFTPARGDTTRALQHYHNAELSFQQSRYDEALLFAEHALEEEPQPSIRREGMFRRYYFPYLLRGRIRLRLRQPEQALVDFNRELEEGIIKGSPEHLRLLTESMQEARNLDVQPPAIAVTTVEVLETSFEELAQAEELASVRVEGTILESGGLDQVIVGSTQAKFSKSKTQDNVYAFEASIVVDPEVPIAIVAEDKAGQRAEGKAQVPLPPLHLGDAAKGIYAVIVGVDAYAAEFRLDGGSCLPSLKERCADPSRFACYNLPNLSAAANDAENVSRMLLRRGVPPDHIRLLVSRVGARNATVAQALDALAWLSHAPSTKAIFYFSGHGVLSRRHKNLMLMADTLGYECTDLPETQQTELERTSLSVSEVFRFLEESPAPERYVILDACRSPRRGSTRSAAGDEVQPTPGFSIRGTNRGVIPEDLAAGNQQRLPPVVFYATFEERVSVEWSQKGAGYFTWYLLQGLRRDLPLSEFGRFVQENVRRRTQEDLCGAGDEACPYVQRPYIELPKELAEDYELQARTFILKSSESETDSESRESQEQEPKPEQRR